VQTDWAVGYVTDADPELPVSQSIKVRATLRPLTGVCSVVLHCCDAVLERLSLLYTMCVRIIASERAGTVTSP